MYIQSSNFYFGYNTASAGTAIVKVIPCVPNFSPRILEFSYTAGATEHTCSIMKCVAHTFTTAPSIAGATDLTLASIHPGRTTSNVDEDLTSGDYLVWICKNNMMRYDTVASVSGNVVTTTNPLAEDINNAQKVWCFYEPSRSTNVVVKLPAGETTNVKGPIMAGFSARQGMKTSRQGSGDPMIVHFDNITNAGSLNWMGGDYLNKTHGVI